MKKKIAFPFLLLAAFSMVACGNDTPAPSISIEEVSSSEETSSSEEESSSELSLIDYAAETHLTEDYFGKSFLKDGIGQVDLKQKIDGDTAHFYPVGTKSNLIKARYNCIDTPESTGMIEPYGYGASDRNGELLASAKTIVLSTDPADQGDKGSVPVTDSTGGRYLTYIWVSEKANAPHDELRLVNLILVQEGWSKQKSATGKQFANAFLNANNQAMQAGLNIWSGQDDPDERYQKAKAQSSEVSLKNIVEGKNAVGEDFDWVGSKATFEATVAATGPDKGACYLNEDIDGKRYGIYVFTQYKELKPLTVIGNRVKITGTVARFGEDEESGDEGTLQLVDAKYSPWGQEGDIETLEKGNGTYQELTGSIKDLAIEDNINVICSLKGLTCYGGKAVQDTATKTAFAFTLWCRDSAGEEINIRIDDGLAIYPGDQPGGDNTQPRVQSIEYFKSATNIDVKGAMVTYYGRYQIKLCTRTDLVVTGADPALAY